MKVWLSYRKIANFPRTPQSGINVGRDTIPEETSSRKYVEVFHAYLAHTQSVEPEPRKGIGEQNEDEK